MLWSLSKIAAFFTLVLAVSIFAGMMSDDGGQIRIWAFNHEFTLGPIAAVIVGTGAVAGIWLALKLLGLIIALLRFLTGDETAFSRFFARNRQKRGLRALSEGMIALASGEPETAMVRARTASRLLDQPELTHLLRAQASEAMGDSRAATEAWKALLANDDTRFVAVRGLMRQKMAKGDTATALKLAEQAFALKPKHAETQDVLLKLQAEGGDWQGARLTLGQQHRSGALPRAVYRRRDALLALQEAKVVLDENSTIEAREAAIEANKLSPDLIPAAVIAAEALSAKGDKKAAARVLKKAWSAQAHPDLAKAFAALEPDETAAARLKRFKPLLAANAKDPEARLTEAELLLGVEDFAAAKAVVADLTQGDLASQRSLAILAAAERGLGASDADVQKILQKALMAPRGAQWWCDKCEASHEDWRPICPHCEGFDTLSWRLPRGQGARGSSIAPELAPLLFVAQGAETRPTKPDAVLLEAEEIDPPAQKQPRILVDEAPLDRQAPETPDEILRRAT